MDPDLMDDVRARLEGADLDADARRLVIAACVDGHLDAVEEAVWSPAPDAPPTATTASGVHLTGITVEGFRGVGPRTRLDLAPGPGLTVVVGRNGSGKSTFAEGLEMALTGTSTRWEGRAKVWTESWRNLHHDGPAAIEVELVLPPDGTTTLTHRWDDGDGLDEGTAALTDGRTVADLGWEVPLAQHRPLLSFNELGGMFEGRQADLYDAITTVLGVEAVRAAAEVLRQARLADEKPLKEVKKALPGLLAQLREAEDERAAVVLAALEGRTWDLRAAMATVQEESSATPSSDLARLRGLASVDAPSPVDSSTAARALREAADAHRQAAATDAGRADRIAVLLRQAVACVTHDGAQPCPLCGSGTVLDEAWAARASAEAEGLGAQAAAVREAEARLVGARRRARVLLPAIPEVLEVAGLVGLDAGEVVEAWKALLDAPEEPDALADHLEAAVPAVEQAVAGLREVASAELDRRQSDWRPVAAAVTRWVSEARDAQAADRRAKQAKVAEQWLADTANAIEAERFEPIREAVQRYWDRLKLQSNVSLKELSLTRSGSRRSLEMDVAVDGSDASALGVMSQGELHALALAVFLPRATLGNSPFSFLVLDDPVQAMDPAKVEGLAGVLEEVARTRQVVVFTHDTRLSHAVRDLGIEATILEVSRGERSQVSLGVVRDPVQRHLADARVVARETEQFSQKVRDRLVAQMGRSALEAACVRIVRGRRLARGDRHQDVEDQLASTHGVHPLVTLALFGDPRRSGDVMPALNRWSREDGDAFMDCKEGAHAGTRRLDDETFLRALSRLIRKLEQEAV